MPEPRFEHDCTACTFLGEHENCDVYACDQGGTFPTIILRASDEPSDYASGQHLLERIPAEMAARAREAVPTGWRA